MVVCAIYLETWNWNGYVGKDRTGGKLKFDDGVFSVVIKQFKKYKTLPLCSSFMHVIENLDLHTTTLPTKWNGSTTAIATLQKSAPYCIATDTDYFN